VRCASSPVRLGIACRNRLKASWKFRPVSRVVLYYFFDLMTGFLPISWQLPFRFVWARRTRDFLRVCADDFGHDPGMLIRNDRNATTLIRRLSTKLFSARLTLHRALNAPAVLGADGVPPAVSFAAGVAFS